MRQQGLSNSIWARMRGGPGLAYGLAGLITWPLATLVIYWGDRFTGAMPGLDQATASISLRASASFALLISALILVAGWVQSTRKS
jgi:hypothetical protein